MESEDVQIIIDRTNAMLDRDGLDDDFFHSLGIKRIDVKGVKGYVTPFDSEQANHVGLADLEKDQADKTIEKVIEFYKNEKKSFSWIVGPTSRPDDLNERLINHGFNYRNEISAYGFYMNTTKTDLRVNPEFEVTDVPLEFLGGNIDLMVNAFGTGMDKNVAMSLIGISMAINSTERYKNEVRAYVAREKATGKYVGFAIMEMDKKGSYAILDGAAVLPEYRGKGIYRNMVAARIDDAAESNIKYLIIHAMKSTSAPICEKAGFKKACELNLYSYNF